MTNRGWQKKRMHKVEKGYSGRIALNGDGTVLAIGATSVPNPDGAQKAGVPFTPGYIWDHVRHPGCFVSCTTTSTGRRCIAPANIPNVDSPVRKRVEVEASAQRSSTAPCTP